MVRSQYCETSQQVFVGPLPVQRLFLLEREKSLGPQGQQRPVESNWVWNINFPFGKRRNLHFWTIDSLPSRWPWLLTWNSFYFDEVHICLSFWVYLDLPELKYLQPLPSSWLAIGLAGWICGLFIPSSKAGIQMASLKTPALVCAVLSCFSRVWLSVTPWTVARQAPLSMGFLQARTLEWVAPPSSRWPSRSRDRTHSLTSPALAGGSLPLAPPGKSQP